jgi:hypothetical protein
MSGQQTCVSAVAGPLRLAGGVARHRRDVPGPDRAGTPGRRPRGALGCGPPRRRPRARGGHMWWPPWPARTGGGRFPATTSTGPARPAGSSRRDTGSQPPPPATALRPSARPTPNRRRPPGAGTPSRCAPPCAGRCAPPRPARRRLPISWSGCAGTECWSASGTASATRTRSPATQWLLRTRSTPRASRSTTAVAGWPPT